jgi:hypothetical protein
VTTAKAIMFSGFLVSASILLHVGYTVARDRECALAAKAQEQAARDQQRRNLEPHLWEYASQGIDRYLVSWIEAQMKLKPTESADIRNVMLKTFNRGDVEWTDESRVSVKGYIRAGANGTDGQWFAWHRTLILADDGNWTDPEYHFQFARASVSNEQAGSWLVKGLRF